MSARYLQTYRELYDIGLSKADFYYFLNFCQKELTYKSCCIEYKTIKELAQKHDRSYDEFKKFIKSLEKNDLVRKGTFETFDENLESIIQKALYINPEYVFFGTIESRKSEIERYLSIR